MITLNYNPRTVTTSLNLNLCYLPTEWLARACNAKTTFINNPPESSCCLLCNGSKVGWLTNRTSFTFNSNFLLHSSGFTANSEDNTSSVKPVSWPFVTFDAGCGGDCSKSSTIGRVYGFFRLVLEGSLFSWTWNGYLNRSLSPLLSDFTRIMLRGFTSIVFEVRKPLTYLYKGGVFAWWGTKTAKHNLKALTDDWRLFDVCVFGCLQFGASVEYSLSREIRNGRKKSYIASATMKTRFSSVI